jgi:hypothetical protein
MPVRRRAPHPEVSGRGDTPRYDDTQSSVPTSVEAQGRFRLRQIEPAPPDG